MSTRIYFSFVFENFFVEVRLKAVIFRRGRIFDLVSTRQHVQLGCLFFDISERCYVGTSPNERKNIVFFFSSSHFFQLKRKLHVMFLTYPDVDSAAASHDKRAAVPLLLLREKNTELRNIGYTLSSASP